ncbi:ABC transporter permease [Pedosphaera parvula]|uniref:Monosaccharide-transporting ATPase n=1 Tax=Pedosphaera parvula (strain Ellin514) TaxID=320771 RepID=B9XKI6_PEDPL|nr:ABC transporter permease [Pedosphaera parvula]EEF59656.1 Monosaccharide-transporting ATPase [Pedosphaera parvula Ellin514]
MSANNSPATPVRSRRLRLQEGGLLVVILLLGVLLTVFGGSVKVPKFETNAEGERVRVFRTNESGDKEPVLVEKNKFLNAQNLAQVAKDTSFIAIMAVGATFVIISGGIDLSVGAIYALASVLGALVLQRCGPEGAHAGLSPWISVSLGMLACVGTAVLCGFLNGGMIVALRVHPFIITLGTMAILRGVAFVITKGQSIGGFPQAFRDLIRWEIGDGLSLVPLVVMIIVTIVGGIYLARLATGRRVYAIGGNELASKFSGIQVNRVKLSVYIISGLTAGIAALLSIGYYGGATSGDGQGYELNVIAAAVVGGASLAGGKGSALGALLGALVIQLITTGIVILQIDQNYSQIIMGIVVIVAVVLDQLNNLLAKRRLLSHSK